MLEELGRGRARAAAPRSTTCATRPPAARRSKRRDVVIHLAANVGGIGYNLRNPAPLVYDNALMALQRVRAVGAGRGVDEARGRLHGLRVPEAHARPVLGGRPLERLPGGVERSVRHREALRCSCSPTPTGASTAPVLVPVVANLYGPDDNFDLENSHVIAALIRKYVEAPQRPAQAR